MSKGRLGGIRKEREPLKTKQRNVDLREPCEKLQIS